jgi:putative CocE/NonD family hydrolase
MVDYFFHADKTASLLPPSPATDVSTTYTVDPANPILTVGGNNLPPGIGGSIPCGPMDQSEQDKRSDVLTFQTEAFTSDFAMTGSIYATLFVSSDAIDTDFMVKISDVYPTGEAILIQDNALRMRWREGGITPVYMTKDEVYKVEMNLWNTSWVVAPGHSLRVSVSSSNNPRFSVNPHNGLLLKDPAYPGQNITARNTLYHSAKYPSKISLPMVNKLLQLPKVHSVVKEVQTAYPHVTDSMFNKFMNGLTSRMMTSKKSKK